MPFVSGNYNFTGVTCPTGSTLEYSVDGGVTWSTTQPSYPNSSAESFQLCVRCVCDLDGTASSTTCVAVNSVDPTSCPTCPDLSSAPTAPVVTDSFCS